MLHILLVLQSSGKIKTWLKEGMHEKARGSSIEITSLKHMLGILLPIQPNPLSRGCLFSCSFLKIAFTRVNGVDRFVSLVAEDFFPLQIFFLRGSLQAWKLLAGRQQGRRAHLPAF